MVSRSAPCNNHRVTSNSYIQQFENDFRVSVTTLGFQQPVPTISRKNANSHYPGSPGPQKERPYENPYKVGQKSTPMQNPHDVPFEVLDLKSNIAINILLM